MNHFVTYEDSNRKAGVGDQVKNVVSAMLVAEYLGWSYKHSPGELDWFLPLELVAPLAPKKLRTESRLVVDQHFKHAPGEGIPEVRRKEVFGSYAPFVEEKKASGASLAVLNRLKEETTDVECLVFKKRFRFQLHQASLWTQERMLENDIYSPVVARLRNCFKRHPRYLARTRTSSALQVAIHIRRGDIVRLRRQPHDQHYSHPISFYETALNQIRDCLSGNCYRVVAYTNIDGLNTSLIQDVIDFCRRQGDIELKVSKDRNNKLSILDDFFDFMDSDYLVVSNSSLSQVAGHVSEGMKLYCPNRHYYGLQDSSFVALDSNGSIE